MSVLRVSVAILFFVCVAVAQKKCQMKPDQFPSYPPPANTTIEWFDINLDLAPADRWTEVVTAKRDAIENMLDTFLSIIPKAVIGPLLSLIDKEEASVIARMPLPYRDELTGIAKATGIDVGKIFIYNIFYELFGACTSVVSEDTNKHVIHARNLDFGLFMGWDFHNHTWALAEALKLTLFNARFVSNGQTAFKTTQYAGYIGLLTGVKEKGFSFTVNTRFDTNFDKYVIEWFMGRYSGNWLTWLLRDIMTTNTTYTQALSVLSSAPLIGPAYVAVGGWNDLEGAIVTREAERAIDVWDLKQAQGNQSYFVLQTNYDHWTKMPFFDDRVTAAVDCMQNHITASGITKATMFNMLSSRPNLNRLTTYTTLMCVETGELESYLQACDDPTCPFW